ncbi:MAG TPA: patatin-like phospholipase family protein [Candidatus Aquilonibacter sp.]|nr:patatin-like phospholipase family protein [Candidatus Aquilonibacter sp.]
MEWPIRGVEMPHGRVVTLTFLSRYLSASFFTEPVARHLHAETGAPVALIRLTDDSKPQNSNERKLLNFTLNDGFQLPPQLPLMDAGFCLVNLKIGNDLLPAGWIASLLEQLQRRFHYVLIEALAEELTAPSLFEFLLRSDLGYLFVRPSNDDVYHLDLLIRELHPQPDSNAVKLKPVLCLGEGELVDGYDALIRGVAGPVDVFIRDCPKSPDDNARPADSFHAGLRRLSREIGGCLVGLALSSGAAKGLSHIGVIQVLEENGIDVDVVAGSSMGAYVGAIWNSGKNGAQLEAIAREMESRWAFLSLIDPVFPPRQGFVRGFGVKRRLMKSIGHLRFAELQRPLRVLATNLETLERTVFSSGEVADAVHASMAVPGICVPVKIDGETYVDGGIVDPLPVDVLREMGVSRIIAVNAIPTSDRIRYCVQAEHELAQLSRKRAREVIRKWFPLETHLNYFARGNILEILMRSIHGAQIRMAESLGRKADIVLRPQICDDRWLDFRDPGRFIQPGRQIAERYLDEIKALVARKAVEHETTLEPMVAAA